MYSYVTAELPALINASFPTDAGRQGIFGHSMGGHGALDLRAQEPGQVPLALGLRADLLRRRAAPGARRRSPAISAPSATPGATTTRACSPPRPTGAARSWSTRAPPTISSSEQLKPELLQDAFRAADIPLTLRYQAGYDHSYYFMASFMADHIAHHARLLKA